MEGGREGVMLTSSDLHATAQELSLCGDLKQN